LPKLEGIDRVKGENNFKLLNLNCRSGWSGKKIATNKSNMMTLQCKNSMHANWNDIIRKRNVIHIVTCFYAWA
jgi:hypothetical protein